MRQIHSHKCTCIANHDDNHDHGDDHDDDDEDDDDDDDDNLSFFAQEALQINVDFHADVFILEKNLLL